MTTKQERDERFVEAVRMHSPAMFRAARSLLRQDADAQDAVSAAITRCYQGITRLRKWEAIRPYLIKAAVNASYDILRRSQREYATDNTFAFEAKDTPEETPIWAYLETLPPKSRLVMQLRYGEDLPVKEIARVLRLPRGSVSVIIGRALKQLRQAFEQEDARHA